MALAGAASKGDAFVLPLDDHLEKRAKDTGVSGAGTDDVAGIVHHRPREHALRSRR